jgi:hypothetical protein
MENLRDANPFLFSFLFALRRKLIVFTTAE